MERGLFRIYGKICAAIVCIAGLLVSGLTLSVCQAEMEENAFLRVGWYQSAGFQDGMQDGVEKSGYSQEYLQRIASYTNWNYIYIYGEWADLMEKLETGQIDILAGVSMTEERRAKMLFPNFPMGYDNYFLYQHDDKKSMVVDDLGSFSGKKIGCIRNNRMTYFLEKWARDKRLTLDIIYYDGFKDRDRAFLEGTIDGITAADNNIQDNTGYAPVVKIGEEPFYLAVANRRKDLLPELNRVLSLINQNDPDFLQSLQYSSYGATLANKTLSEKESKWLAKHREWRIGYVKNYMPLCGADNFGNAQGAFVDYFQHLLSVLNLADKVTCTYVGFDNFQTMQRSLARGDLDVGFPALAESKFLNAVYINGTAKVADVPVYVAYKGEYNDATFNKIAIFNRPLKKIKNEYPQSEITTYSTGEDCVDAIMDGTATCTVMASYRLQDVLNDPKYRDIKTMPFGLSMSYCIGVNKEQPELRSILNKSIALSNNSIMIDYVFKYLQAGTRYTVGDFIHKNIGAISVLTVLALGIILLSLNKYLQDMRQAKQKAEGLNQQLQQEKEKLEQARREAEAANEAKTSFLFNMSHDVRTPMNAIIGFRDLLEKHQDNPEKRTNYLRKIEESSMVLLSIINNVLEMARIEKGTVEIDETAWSAEQFNDTLYSVFDEMMKEKGIDFTRSIDVVNHYIFCDPIKQREVFINILSNAYKYTNSGGKVHMAVKELPSDRVGYVIYQTIISDTGIGMSEAFLPHLFEEFSREANTTDNKIEGTGLGMPIVKRLVKLMDGTIKVTSTKGVGTTFTVTFPYKIADKSNLVEHAGIELDPKLFRGKRILLAEDNDFNAEIAMEILKEPGFIIERAEDGQICLDMVRNAPANYYDLILMDIQMPNMNGFEATKAIRHLADSTKSKIPIVAMTANAFEEDKRESVRCGMNAHLAKPVNVRALMQTLAENLF